MPISTHDAEYRVRRSIARKVEEEIRLIPATVPLVPIC